MEYLLRDDYTQYVCTHRNVYSILATVCKGYLENVLQFYSRNRKICIAIRRVYKNG